MLFNGQEMAARKKQMAMDVKKYLETLAQEAGFDEATKQAVLKAAENEKFSKKLGDELMTRADYSRNQDALRAEREQFDAKKKEIETWYATALPEYKQTLEQATQTKQQAEQAQRMVQAYAQLYGPLDGYTPPAANSGNGSPNGAAHTDTVTKAELQKALDTLRQTSGDQAASIMATAVPLAIRHFKQFGEELDFNALIEQAKKVSAQPLTPLDRAYEVMTAERRTAMAADERKKHDDQIRADAIKDFQSKNNLPIDTKPRESSVFFDRPKEQKAPVTEHEKQAAFAKIWSETSEGASAPAK